MNYQIIIINEILQWCLLLLFGTGIQITQRAVSKLLQIKKAELDAEIAMRGWPK